MLTNYHCHSNFCDGNSPLEAYVKTALEFGLASLGFSSHCPIPVANGWSMKAENITTYYEQIEQLKQKYKGQIEIYTSLEIDYLVDCNIVESFDNLDYKLTSVHYCGKFADGSLFEVDGSSTLFEKGINEIYDGSIAAFLQDYFGKLNFIASNTSTDIIGHIDKIKIHRNYDTHWLSTNSLYVGLLENFLDEVARTNKLIELNTRGLYKKKTEEPYPSSFILQMINHRKIGIVLNSDSHTPAEIVSNYDEAIQLAKEAGIHSSWHYIQNDWKEVAF